MKGYLPTAAVLAALYAGQLAAADDVRYYTENGVTYRETRRIVKRPVSETRIHEQQRTVYRRRIQTENRQITRDCLVPVTEWRWQTCWEGWLNPFTGPYMVHKLVPCTRWQLGQQVTTVPETRCVLVPEKVVTRVPVTSRRIEEAEVITRVAVQPRRAVGAASTPQHASSNTGTPTLARREAIGGITRHDDDPPRIGGQPAWRPNLGTVRR
jgi:hypothetical protein